MKRKNPTGKVRGRREKGGTSQVEGVQFEFKKSFSRAKDVKLSKTQRSYTVKTEVNLGLAGNPFPLQYSKLWCQYYPWERILLLLFGNLVWLYLLLATCWDGWILICTKLFPVLTRIVCPQYLLFYKYVLSESHFSIYFHLPSSLTVSGKVFDCKQQLVPL